MAQPITTNQTRLWTDYGITVHKSTAILVLDRVYTAFMLGSSNCFLIRLFRVVINTKNNGAVFFSQDDGAVNAVLYVCDVVQRNQKEISHHHPHNRTKNPVVNAWNGLMTIELTPWRNYGSIVPFFVCRVVD